MFIYTAVKNRYLLHGHVFVMYFRFLEQICIVDLPDGKHLKQPISLKRKHTRNDNDGDRAKVKKLTTSAHKVLERPSTQPSRLKIGKYILVFVVHCFSSV